MIIQIAGSDTIWATPHLNNHIVTGVTLLHVTQHSS